MAAKKARKAKSTRRKTSRRRTGPSGTAEVGPGPGGDGLLGQPQDPDFEDFTGRYIVTFREGAEGQALSLLGTTSGIKASKVARSADFAEARVDIASVEGTEVLVLDDLAIAVVSVDPDRGGALSASVSEQGPVLAVEPERRMYALADTSVAGVDYLRGYRDAVNNLFDRFQVPGSEELEAEMGVAGFVDNATATWGLQATKVVQSRYSGRGIRVAVLDTGFDLRHPDFKGRSIATSSFVPGQSVQDGHGHGTHCIGTACGPRAAGSGPRYGIAYGSTIYVGKVLSNGGSGYDSWILAGMNWAVHNRCQVISMSLGAAAPPSVAYEQAGLRALQKGTLIVAASGNDSQRRLGIFRPVGRPANSLSILAVGAVDSNLRVADFSNRGTVGAGGQIDIAGPGVAVRSSWPRPQTYRSISGTSMATPHVAGIAALHSEARGSTGAGLWHILASTAQRLSASSMDVGAGLVLAP